MPIYAQNTDVGSDKSKAEIERTLSRYGAEGFMYGWNKNAAIVGFEMNKRHIKFQLKMPDKNSGAFTTTDTGRARKQNQIELAYEQAIRQRWRALALVIKAKLEAVDSGIAEFEEEFLANIVLPGGKTVGQNLLPQIKNAYETGKMPKLLPMNTK